jgi:hypothetical protein
MYDSTLKHFLDLSDEELESKILFGTKNGYEFTMVATYIAKNWYAIVLDPDFTRVTDIDQVIREEFNAKTLGWCLVQGMREGYGSLLPFKDGTKHLRAVTYWDGAGSGWVLQIKPEESSRLLQVGS